MMQKYSQYYSRPAKSSHCGVCNNCVIGFDHHCTFLNNCIGRRNVREFVLLLLFGLVTSALVIVLGAAIVWLRLAHISKIEGLLGLDSQVDTAILWLLGAVVTTFLASVLNRLQYYLFRCGYITGMVSYYLIFLSGALFCLHRSYSSLETDKII